jgi:hypothetical protein
MHGVVTVLECQADGLTPDLSPLIYAEMDAVRNVKYADAGLADVSEMHVAVIGSVDRVFRLDDGGAIWIGQRICACRPDGGLAFGLAGYCLGLKTFSEGLLLILFELGDGGHINLGATGGAEN